jgi:Mrp family chromosome partitioning ATPase
VLNAPALDDSPSTLVWAEVVDATVLVVKEGKTSRTAVADAIRSLSLVRGARFAGTVLRERGHALLR